MAEQPRGDWLVATRVDAVAAGPTGRRTFQVVVETGDRAARLTVEKEQLQVLAMLVEQLLTGLPAVQVRNPALEGEPELPAPQALPTEPDVDFRVARLSLGIDQERDVFVLMAYAAEEQQDEEPTYGCLLNRAQLRRLSRQITALVAGGRPRCPLCQAPLGPEPHRCAGSNGHVAAPD